MLLNEKVRGSIGGNADAAIDASHFFRVQAFLAVDDRDQDDAFRQLGGLFDRSFQPLFDVLLDQQPIDDDLDRMILLLVQLDRFVEIVKDAVDAAAHVTRFLRAPEAAS